MRTRSITVTAVAAAVLAISGGTALAMGAAAERPAGAVSLASSPPSPPYGQQPVPAGPVVDRAAAERTALQAAGGGVVTKSELDDSDDDSDAREWEIDVRNGDVEHEIDIDATTGQVTDQDTDDSRDDDRSDDRSDDRDDERDD